MQSLLTLSRAIDAFTRWTGKRLAWLILLAVIVSAVNALVRKVFDTSSNSWLELQWLLFSIVFLLCSPWTLLDNEHIRIDIVNNMMPKKVRDSIDVVGHIVFLLCSPWTLLDNEHIRIDIVNNMLPKKLRDSIDLVGHVAFLMPLTVVMIITGVPFFQRSYEINEQSGNAGGLPQWPAKSLVMIGFALLLIQAISELIKRIAVMRGLIPDPHASQVNALEAEVEHLVEAMAGEKH